jgi:hypothetical protein
LGKDGDANQKAKSSNEQISNLQSIIFGCFHLQSCEEAKRYADFLDSKRDNDLTYDDNETLKKKGYGYEAINQISR